MNYISNRAVTITSTSGRSVHFEKGVPTFAPPIMHAELISAGVVPEETMDEDEKPAGVVEPTVPHEREAALFEVFEKLVLANNREDFTGTGQPHASVLNKVLGWPNKIGNKERDAAWAKFQQANSNV